MRAEYIPIALFYAVISELTYPNQLAMRIALKTGLRINDVLSLRKSQLKIRPTIHEQKTGKARRIYFGAELYRELCAYAFHYPKFNDSDFVFPHRTNNNRHRTRQAVYKDVKKAVAVLRLSGQISPHSARKCAAVREFVRTKSIERVRQFLNHDRELTTILYALSDQPVLQSLFSSQKPF